MIRRGRLYRRLINSTEWQRLRNSYIREHPLCEDCLAGGRYKVAVEVHHVRPVERTADPHEQERRMFDADNLRALCHECHVRTHRELGKRKRPEIIERRKEYTRQAIDRLFGEEKTERPPE